MTKVIIIQGGSLESYYEQTLNYLHQKYHTYPSKLLDLYVDPDIMAEVSMYERLAHDTASSAPPQLMADGRPLPKGKIVL
jgi:hypothetical protein